MEDAEDKKEYEIAYVAATEDGAGEIERELAALGCAVTGKGQLAAMKLAYPIQKHASGFFGYYWFSAMPDAVKKLSDALALKPAVLRFLVVTPPVKPFVRENRAPRERGIHIQPKAAPSGTPKEAPAAPRASEILSNELLEKKLEEILK